MAPLQEKKERIKKLFSIANSPEEKYQVIIDLGKQQEKLDEKDRIEKNLVHGCQSTTYLKSEEKEGLLFFHIESDALISSGLGQLLTQVYSGESVETLLKNPPTYLEELGIQASLSPGRANGLASMWKKMCHESLAFLKK